ncbi:MAG TPA: hypothetical protein PLV06_12910 [Bacteroidales bacterium]|nr:hypothetical protein [Bacteroidales bacterium]HPF02909.1 hypothetical protein [Bacteroidales bacterium]HPJ60091.1 hypothetical protein [Bacteroidales bacterium]HPR13281.1 hypothetical protein [Bacteroidales bacterium]HRW85562.1 hypothetical protein [Bacteroidales bacterium]
MKNKILYGFALVLISVGLLTSCETDMEKAQEAYDASQVVPKIMGATGPGIALQTFSYQYKVTYSRAGSTWDWTVTGGTIESVSSDTKTITVLYSAIPANDTALISVTETTVGGVTSPSYTLKTHVKPYCPLTNGVADLVGTWTGDDAWYESLITTEANGTTGLKVSHMNEWFMQDWWGEEITAGGTIEMTVNIDGTVVIPRQYIFTTLYDGDPYDYEIDGSGTWDNCGASPAMVIIYNVYYEGENECFAAPYSPTYLPTTYFTADIELDVTKSKQSVASRPVLKSPRR